MLFALIAAVATQPAQARATVRIMPAAKISRDDWKKAPRRREIVNEQKGQRVTIRLVEFE